MTPHTHSLSLSSLFCLSPIYLNTTSSFSLSTLFAYAPQLPFSHQPEVPFASPPFRWPPITVESAPIQQPELQPDAMADSAASPLVSAKRSADEPPASESMESAPKVARTSEQALDLSATSSPTLADVPPLSTTALSADQPVDTPVPQFL